jgi:hypothetical protein
METTVSRGRKIREILNQFRVLQHQMLAWLPALFGALEIVLEPVAGEGLEILAVFEGVLEV